MKFNILSRKTATPYEVMQSIKSHFGCGTTEAMDIFQSFKNSTPEDIFESETLYLALYQIYSLREIVENYTELYLGKYLESYTEEEIEAANTWKAGLDEEQSKHLSVVLWSNRSYPAMG